MMYEEVVEGQYDRLYESTILCIMLFAKINSMQETSWIINCYINVRLLILGQTTI